MRTTTSAQPPHGGSVATSGLLRFEVVRLFALLALSTTAIAWPLLTFAADGAHLPAVFGACAAALVLGARYGDEVADGLSRIISVHWLASGWVFYLLWSTWVMLSLRETTTPGMSSDSWVHLAMLQPVMLLLGSINGAYRGAIVNAFVLTMVTCHAGGVAAAGAVVSYVATMGVFLVFDNWKRLLSSYPLSRSPSVLVPVGQALVRVTLISVGLMTFYTYYPPAAADAFVDKAIAGVTLTQPSMSSLWSALVQLGGIVLVGVGLLYGLGQVLRNRAARKPGSQELEEEKLTGHTAPEASLGRAAAGGVAYTGAHGRIVRAYLTLLSAMSEAGMKRRPGHTPRELAASMSELFTDAEELTSLFEGARYGGDEPTAAQVSRAEELVRRLKPGAGLRQRIREITKKYVSVAWRAPRSEPPDPGKEATP